MSQLGMMSHLGVVHCPSQDHEDDLLLNINRARCKVWQDLDVERVLQQDDEEAVLRDRLSTQAICQQGFRLLARVIPCECLVTACSCV